MEIKMLSMLNAFEFETEWKVCSDPGMEESFQSNRGPFKEICVFSLLQWYDAERFNQQQVTKWDYKLCRFILMTGI